VKWWLRVAALAAVAVFATGCNLVGSDDDGRSAGSAREGGGSTPTAGPLESTPAGGPTTRRTGGPSASKKPIPEACKLLSNAEVGTLTGQRVEEISDTSLPNDPEQSGCIWHLTPGGALYLSMHRTDLELFGYHDTGQRVTGVGDDAWWDGMHFAVLVAGTIDMDIIVRAGESDARHLDRSIDVAKKVVPRI